jgi:AcrR family transcriptional regulator
MKAKSPRKYSSPLRESQAHETRERILEAVAAWMQNDTPGDFTFDAIARQASIERRTVFRHFGTKEALLEAFWDWINQRFLPNTLPQSLDELLDGPRSAFPKFDEVEGVIRGSLHTPAGRAMRKSAIPARRQAFHAALREATRGANQVDRRRLEAVAHVLYSASAWEAMRDYAGITGQQAGDAASWALAILLNFVRPADNRSLRQTANPSPTTSTRKRKE